MSRKHFNSIAAMMREQHPGSPTVDMSLHENVIAQEKVAVWENLFSGLVDICRSENSNFDYSRFRAACLPETEA